MTLVSRESVPLARFGPYLPDVASDPALSRGEPLTRDAVTLFVDIAGFTGLSERLARHGTAGTEQLGGIVRRVIGGALDIVVGHHGDALAFGGDAITVVFVPGDATWAAARLAAQEVIALVEATSGTATLAGPVDITVRIGVSGGRVTSFVCPAEVRHTMVHLGPGLDRAVAAAQSAGRGHITVDPAELGPAAAHPRRPLPQWAPRVLHTVTASRIAAASELPDEHRRVTMAFLSLPEVDDRDSEALRALSGFVSAAANVVTESGGDILQCTGGDKGIVLVAMFGAPLAHPDDAARAIHAIDRLRATSEVGFAAGVSTGLAFAAAFGGQTRRFVSALGDSTNLAARLMATAVPGSTLIDRPTAVAVEGRAQVGETRLVTVKNRDQPVEAMEVRGIVRPGRDLEADGDTPLVGREVELAAAEALLDATPTAGSALHLVGEAGSGKSRLAGEIARRAQVRGLAVRVGRFEMLGTGRPLGPFADVLRERPGHRPIATADDLAAAIDEVRPGDESLAPLLGPLLGLHEPDTAATVALSDDERSELGRRLVVDLLCAASVPTLVVLDDLHWADEASLRMLSELARRLAGTSVSVLTTRRPGHVFAGQPALEIADLSEEHLGTIVRDTWGRLGGGELPTDYVHTLVARAAGSPLFAQTVTELVRRSYRPGLPLPNVPLPDELLPFLTAQLDALGDSAQATALRAAVFGRPTSGKELAHVFDCDAGATADDLERLASAGIVSGAGGREPLMWLRHATVAEALMARASHADRAPLHELVCRYLVDTGASARDIARQLEHCDLPDLKPHWYRAARREASARWGLGEARHWAKLALAAAGAGEAAADAFALAELEQQLGDHTHAAERLAGLEGANAERLLGRIAFETGRPADAVRHLERAQQLGATGPAMTWPLTMALCDLGRFDEARTSALGQLETAGADDGQLRLDALANLGVVEFRQGDLARASQVLEEARSLAAELGDVLRLAHVTGDLAGARFATGRLAEAAALLAEAASLAERLGARRLVTMVLGNVTQVRLAGGDREGAARAAVASADAALEIGDLAIALDCLQVPAVVAELDGDSDRAAEWWREHALLEEQLGRRHDSAISWFRRAAVAAWGGDLDGARAAIERAEAGAQGLETEDVDIHRARANSALLGRYGPPPEATTAPIDLPPLDASLPVATPHIVDEQFIRIAVRLAEQARVHA